jgi:hypothetical protein
MRWKIRTPMRDQLRIYRCQEEVPRAELRLEAEKAVAEFQRKREATPAICAPCGPQPSTDRTT